MSKSNSPVGVLQLRPLSPYLQQEISKRFTLFKYWEVPVDHRPEYLEKHRSSIRAVVADGARGANADLIEALPHLEIVSSHSSGLDTTDLEKCREKGIRVTNAPDALTDEVADMAILLALATLRRICEADRFVRRGDWRNGTKFQLSAKFSGKSVGIIGLGRIGSAIARRAEAFGCSINYHSRTAKPDLTYKYYPSVISLASNSQILIVACALTPETRHIVNRDVIDALGSDGVVINIGRGGHIDEPELISALTEGRLSGAGLDVFENEPDVSDELRGLNNVVLAPHAGSSTFETRKALADVVVANLEAYFSNKPLLTPVI